MSHTHQHLEHDDTLERLGGDQELLRELYAAYAADMPGKLRGLRESLERRDAKAVARLAHSVKGAAAAIGAEANQRMAVELERAAQRGDLGATRDLFAAMEREVGIVLARIAGQ